MTDWSAYADAAHALRRLNRAFSGFDVGADELRDVTSQAHELAELLESGPPRNKEDDVVGLTTYYDASATAIGERLEFDPFSVGSGRFHPCSIGFELRREGEASVTATAIVDPLFQGPPGRVHGGVVALIVDEVMAAVNRVVGQRAFTAKLSVNLRAPAPTGTPLVFRAWQRERRGRKITIDVEGRTEAGVFVDGEALFIATDPAAESP
jgi:acyl-coenzyme A thioesterase PaaI-like protein